MPNCASDCLILPHGAINGRAFLGFSGLYLGGWQSDIFVGGAGVLCHFALRFDTPIALRARIEHIPFLSYTPSFMEPEYISWRIGGMTRSDALYTLIKVRLGKLFPCDLPGLDGHAPGLSDLTQTHVVRAKLVVVAQKFYSPSAFVLG